MSTDLILAIVALVFCAVGLLLAAVENERFALRNPAFWASAGGIVLSVIWLLKS